MKVCIDPGHGGYDPGAVGNGLRESQITLSISLKLKKALEERGEEVILTRETDSDVGGEDKGEDLRARVKIANDFNADILVSVHINSFEDSTANGAEAFYYSEKGKKLATFLQYAQLNVMKNRNRGVKFANFYVLKYSSMPAALVESGFITNPNEAKKYKDEKVLYDLANAYADAIETYKKSIGYKDNTENDMVVKRVLEVQQKLNQLKIRNLKGNKLVEDGILGTATKQTVAKFQKMMDLNTDGIPDFETLAYIKKILSKPLLKKGFGDETAIRYVQYRVGANIDGFFGNNTENTVKLWQQNNRLGVDGIVGEKTWNSFFD